MLQKLLHTLLGLLFSLALVYAVFVKPVLAHNLPIKNAATGSFTVFVTKVVDGDTFWGRTPTGQRIKVRILDIDAPEICQTHGRMAQQALAQKIKGQTIVLHNAKIKDDYGRRLATPYWQGQDIAAWLVREGHAWNYTWRNRSGTYAYEQNLAEQDQKGLWTQLPFPEKPRHFRRRFGPCI